jgi:hypothetical protein
MWIETSCISQQRHVRGAQIGAAPFSLSFLGFWLVLIVELFVGKIHECSIGSLEIQLRVKK